MERRRRLLLCVERTSWAAGLAGLVWWGAFQMEVATSAQRAVERFHVRPAAFEPPGAAPLAVLRIPKIGLEVPVMSGTDDRTLDRGVGHIAHTAVPGRDGNSGLAAHRDGFFRGLKDVGAGDAIELETLEGREIYRVVRTWVVDPEDIWVLDPTPKRALTLVTCYPFFFTGPAPRRFIVRAVLEEGAGAAAR